MNKALRTLSSIVDLDNSPLSSSAAEQNSQESENRIEAERSAATFHCVPTQEQPSWWHNTITYISHTKIEFITGILLNMCPQALHFIPVPRCGQELGRKLQFQSTKEDRVWIVNALRIVLLCTTAAVCCRHFIWTISPIKAQCLYLSLWSIVSILKRSTCSLKTVNQQASFSELLPQYLQHVFQDFSPARRLANLRKMLKLGPAGEGIEKALSIDMLWTICVSKHMPHYHELDETCRGWNSSDGLTLT